MKSSSGWQIDPGAGVAGGEDGQDLGGEGDGQQQQPQLQQQRLPRPHRSYLGVRLIRMRSRSGSQLDPYIGLGGVGGMDLEQLEPGGVGVHGIGGQDGVDGQEVNRQQPQPLRLPLRLPHPSRL